MSKRIVILTNIPSPYRNPVYKLVSENFLFETLVVFCSSTEPNRSWVSEKLNFPHVFLSNSKNRFRHFNINVWQKLSGFNPDIVVISGFSLTMLIGFLWCLVKRKKYIIFSDGTIESESILTIPHWLIRKFTFFFAAGFIGASNKTIDLFKSYGVDKEKCTLSCLAVDNEMFYLKPEINKKYDLMYCGQFIERKGPLFFCEIALNLTKVIDDFCVLLVGDGPLLKDSISFLEKNNVNFHSTGAVPYSNLPAYFSSSKLFIFPTRNEPWGLVLNEALSCGVPVVTSPNTGAVGELIIDGLNGSVIVGMDVHEWVDSITNILNAETYYQSLCKNSKNSVADHNFQNASLGILEALAKI